MHRPFANISLRVNYIKSPRKSGSHELNLRAMYSVIQTIHCLRTYWSFAITFTALKFRSGDNLIAEITIIWIALCSVSTSQLYLGRKVFSMLRIWSDIRCVAIYGERHY